MTNEIVAWADEKARVARLAAGVVLSSFALAACGGETSTKPVPTARTSTVPNPQSTDTPETTTTPEIRPPSTPAEKEIPAEDCSFRYVEPGRNFTESNRDDLEEDLALLNSLQAPNYDVRLSDLVTAGRIVKDSYQDPLYAQAIVKARDDIAEGKAVSVDKFLDTPTVNPPKCDANHIDKDASRAQLQQSVSMAQTLSRQLGARAGQQASLLVQSAAEKLEQTFEELRERAEEAERQP